MNEQPVVSKKENKWPYPSSKLVNPIRDRADAGDPNRISKIIEDRLDENEIDVSVYEANIGPRVTQYLAKVLDGEFPSDTNTLKNEISLDLAAVSVRIVSSDIISNVVSVEVPNVKSAIVSLGKLLRSKDNLDTDRKLSFILGKNTACKDIKCDLDSTLHLLMAGQTGSGKSVFYNNLLINLLLKNSPSDLRFIIIDPKQVEFMPYKGIPHLITPVINDSEDAKLSMQWVTAEIDRRYKYLANRWAKNIHAYNQTDPDEVMPSIVILCDEISDLMMYDGKFFEDAFIKIAQKGRAVGIHLILATSRPSTDVITDGMLENINNKIGFTTASTVDSRRILGRKGAEDLLGQGDMLFHDSNNAVLQRIQVPYLTDDDVERVTSHLRGIRPPEYIEMSATAKNQSDNSVNTEDELYLKVLKYVVEEQKAGTAMIQKKFEIGYGRASRIIELLEENGVVGPADGATPRKVYRDEF
ncbi:MAG: DNA translocase FtsK [Candidatus Saccharibacteria bacterium]|nr:DNA translocase FtsK [Candidatus Saccharibacteria bacterium]